MSTLKIINVIMVVLLGMLLLGSSTVGHALRNAEQPEGALETLVASSEAGKVLYVNGEYEGQDHPAVRIPVLKLGVEFPVFLNLVIVDKPEKFDPAGALSMDILDAVNLLAKAIDQKVEYQQSERFQFGIGADINKNLLEFKPDLFLYGTFKLFDFDL